MISLAAPVGCSGDGAPGPTTAAPTIAATTTPTIAPTTTLPPKMRRPLLGDITIETHRTVVLDAPEEVGTCTTVDGGFIWADQMYFDVIAIPVGCRPGIDSSLNGRFGLYRSAAEAADLSVELPAVDTAIGGAEVFVVDYTECTSYCDVLPTPVAVITLDRPLLIGEIEYDVLNLYETNTDGEPQALLAALASLQRSSQPTTTVLDGASTSAANTP